MNCRAAIRGSLLVLFVVTLPVVAAAQNLLVNPDFDRDLAGWTSVPPSAATWDAPEAAARVVANTDQVTLRQCVSVTPGVNHDLIVRIRVPEGQSGTGHAFAGIHYFAGPNCTGETRQVATTAAGVTPGADWHVRTLINRPSIGGDAMSANVDLYVQLLTGASFTALFDRIQFGPTGAFSKRLVIPAAASITGANNSAFRSDLWLVNQSATNTIPVKLTLHCYANSACTTVERDATLFPGRSVEYIDIVTSLFGQSQNAGAIEIRWESYLGEIAATSRLYSPASGPSYGFAMQARPITAALRNTIFPGLGWQGGILQFGFRTNIGFYNPNSTPASVTVSLYRSDGTLLGQLPTTVPPRTPQQINSLFVAVGAAQVETTDAYARVQSDIGIFSYVSILDNATNDASYIEGILDTPNP
ncbi:MAG TPA: hypothetical protein VF701_12210 [Thermoanaerobaculia bacterium]